MSTKKTHSTVRIIAGKQRRRRITFPNVHTIRPTTDRIRETVFNWLSPYLSDACCLDAFAGSGILGFEALSRGAKHVVFIDQLRINIQSIVQNAKKMTLTDHIDTYHTDFFSRHSSTHRPFDIVFLDPPYHQGLINTALPHLCRQHCIDQNSIVYVEGEKGITLQLSNIFDIVRQQSTKKIYFALLKAKSDQYNRDG
jgi:16S rRNA (guanine966-N2)-methyltransferase